MRIFNVEKILELAEECNGDKKFLLSEFVATDELNIELDKMKEAIKRVENGTGIASALLVAHLEIDRIQNLLTTSAQNTEEGK